MATKTITSDRAVTKVGTEGTKLYTSTRTTYSVSDNGEVIQDSVKQEIIYYDAPLSPGIVAATRTGTSNDWKFENSIIGKPILGAAAQKSLKEGALKTTTNQQLEQAARKAGLSKEQRNSVSKDTGATPSDLQGFNILKPEGPAYALQEKGGTKTSGFKNLVYPEGMDENQDRLKIDIIKFKGREFDPQTLKFGNRGGGILKSEGSVTLPIPGNVSDDNRVRWGSTDMNAFDAAVAGSALKLIQDGGSAIDNLTKSIEEMVTDPESSKNFKTGLASFFASQAAGVQGLLARTQGAVLNPNTELLFQGPQLRSFTFTFKLTPRSEAEAKIVRDIIRFFKQGMAVQRTEKEFFLKAPMIFKLQFLKGSTDIHTFLPKIKECALLGCSVNYTPEGNYATYRDSSMVSYEMALTFNELDPIFNDDYGNGQNGQDTDIGF